MSRHGAIVAFMEPIQTPQRSIRIPDRIWRAAQEKAKERGERVSDVVRQALIKYIEEGDK